MAVLETALERLAREFADAGKGELFRRARGFLSGERGEMTYARAAAELGLSEAALKMAVTRMRQRCRELIREEIAHTVTTPAEVEDEYRVLLAALSG